MANARVPMYFWPLTAVVLLAAVALGINRCSPMVSVPVPKSELPAFRLVDRKDVKTHEVSRHDLGDDDVRKTGGIVGHVTLAALDKGKVVATDQLTSAKPDDYAGVPVTVHADASAAGSPRSGDEVQLLFAPRPDSGDAAPLEISAVLLKSSDAKAGGTDYVVAVSSQDRTKVLGVLGRSRLVVVPA